MDIKQEKIKKEYQVYVQRKMPAQSVKGLYNGFLVGV